LTDLVQTGVEVLEAVPLRRIWLTLEGPDIIELKQVVLDRDAEGAMAFFRRVVVPKVRVAARRRGISIEEENDRLPG